MSKKKVNVVFNKKALDKVRYLSEQSKDIETGGILLGYQKSDAIYINFATNPGPKAIREKSRFHRDIEYCQSVIEEHYNKYNSKSIYVGEWHYHPNSSNVPSSIDIKSLREIAVSDNYKTDSPVLLIINNELAFSLTIFPKDSYVYNPKYVIEEHHNEIENI